MKLSRDLQRFQAPVAVRITQDDDARHSSDVMGLRGSLKDIQGRIPNNNNNINALKGSALETTRNFTRLNNFAYGAFSTIRKVNIMFSKVTQIYVIKLSFDHLLAAKALGTWQLQQSSWE